MDLFLVVQAVQQFLDYRRRELFKAVYPVANHCELCGGPRRAEMDGGICNACAARLQSWLDRQLQERDRQDRMSYEEHMRIHHADGSPCAPAGKK
jgi:hypothetical protein